MNFFEFGPLRVAITPEAARALANRLMDYAERAERENRKDAPADWWTGLSARVQGRLREAYKDERIASWPPIAAEVAEIADSEWLRFPNFGRKSLNELRDVLAAHGIVLRP